MLNGRWKRNVAFSIVSGNTNLWSFPQVDCEKVDAPYPAYSESCHEDPDNKPSECKMCPWKPEDHPYFKSKPGGGMKRDMHTSTALHYALDKKGCPKPCGFKREPCGWVEKEVQ